MRWDGLRDRLLWHGWLWYCRSDVFFIFYYLISKTKKPQICDSYLFKKCLYRPHQISQTNFFDQKNETRLYCETDFDYDCDKIVRQMSTISSHPISSKSHLRFLSMISPSTWWNSHKCVTSIVSFLFFWMMMMRGWDGKLWDRDELGDGRMWDRLWDRDGWERKKKTKDQLSTISYHITWRLDQLKTIFLERTDLHPI